MTHVSHPAVPNDDLASFWRLYTRPDFNNILFLYAFNIQGLIIFTYNDYSHIENLMFTIIQFKDNQQCKIACFILNVKRCSLLMLAKSSYLIIRKK